MFQPNKEAPAKERITPPATSNSFSHNSIAASTSLEGEMHCEADLRIDGRVKGTVTCKARIIIGPSGIVTGDLICENAELSGKIFGNIEAKDQIYLKATGYIEGNMQTDKLIVESGARFMGNCRMGVKEMKPNDQVADAKLQKKEAI